jgi:predicted membrane protein
MSQSKKIEVTTGMDDKQTNPINYRDYGVFYHAWARALSLLTALALSGALLVMPHLVATDTMSLKHGPLSLAMWGISAGFVHGIGYVPKMRLWRFTLGPIVAWPLMLWTVYSWFFDYLN